MKLTLETLIELNQAADLIFEAIPSLEMESIGRDIELIQRDPKQMAKLSTGLYRLRANLAVMRQADVMTVDINDDRGLVQTILETVAKNYDLRVSDLRSRSRMKTISDARQIACFIMRQMTGMSLVHIGLQFQRRDHSTILYGIEKVERDPELKIRANQMMVQVKKLLS